MGEVSQYPKGTFCWIDLGTPDVRGARDFYGELFSWRFEEVPGARYLMCRIDGKDVTGIHEHSAEEGANWSSYVSVDDLEGPTARAAELGGTVGHEPFDVGGTARMSVIRDGVGAEVCLWQAKGFIGAGLVNEVGTWTWNELVTRDIEAAKDFSRRAVRVGDPRRPVCDSPRRLHPGGPARRRRPRPHRAGAGSPSVDGLVQGGRRRSERGAGPAPGRDHPPAPDGRSGREVRRRGRPRGGSLHGHGVPWGRAGRGRVLSGSPRTPRPRRSLRTPGAWRRPPARSGGRARRRGHQLALFG